MTDPFYSSIGNGYAPGEEIPPIAVPVRFGAAASPGRTAYTSTAGCTPSRNPENPCVQKNRLYGVHFHSFGQRSRNSLYGSLPQLCRTREKEGRHATVDWPMIAEWWLTLFHLFSLILGCKQPFSLGRADVRPIAPTHRILWALGSQWPAAYIFCRF